MSRVSALSRIAPESRRLTDATSAVESLSEMSSLREKVLETFRRIRERGEDGVWISLLPVEEAIRQAERVEGDSRQLPFRGRTFAIKDNIDLVGLPTTAACPAFAHMPQRSATVVQRLIDAGAVPIGKTRYLLMQLRTSLGSMK
jgi:Asp-tRNA(Asn)/Glu-tRNA(Gln) amidotransferase A subunit family amidase